VSIDFKGVWEGKTTSDNRHSDHEFYRRKAEEIFSLLTDEERAADSADLGCGAGEMLQLLVPHCHVVEALDFSESMLAEARRRLVGTAITFRSDDVFQYLPKCEAAVWLTTGAINQYCDQDAQRQLLSIFAENNAVRTYCLLDTVDADRYWGLFRQGRGHYERTRRPGYARSVYHALRTMAKALSGGYQKDCERIGKMGYSFTTRFWLQAAELHGLKCSIVSSRYYEYRYHVLFRKPWA
jgi:cyclopropane-fatty-acyl-phospholipid synthase